jgi:hypothetical protein
MGQKIHVRQKTMRHETMGKVEGTNETENSETLEYGESDRDQWERKYM